jgi:hypothetical protein
MNKKNVPHALLVRFTDEEKAIMAELRNYYGLSSDNEVLRFALRAAKREMEWQGLKPNTPNHGH